MTDPSGAAGAEGGVILNPTPSKVKKHRSYCLTLNNYTDDELEQWSNHFGECAKNWIIGKEIGEEKTPHLQAYIQYKSSRSFDRMKKTFPRSHIEPARGSVKDNYDYCSKDGDFTTNIDLVPMREKLAKLCLAEYESVVWLPWQQRVIEIVEEQQVCDRKIFWFWEKKGGTGKSFLSKYLALKYDVIICDGKKDNIFNQVNTMIESGKQPKVILMDVPRSNLDYINYGAIEQLKNGMMYSGKYEGGVCIFPSPHVIAFANELPTKRALSADRWVIVDLSQEYS